MHFCKSQAKTLPQKLLEIFGELSVIFRQTVGHSHLNNVSSLPRATSGDSHVLTARGFGFSPNFLLPLGRRFELEKFSTTLKKNARTSRFVSKKPEAAEKQGFLCCLISTLQKQ